jgi:hypothetical protein
MHIAARPASDVMSRVKKSDKFLSSSSRNAVSGENRFFKPSTVSARQVWPEAHVRRRGRFGQLANTSRMLADSGSGGARTGATLSAYEREPNPIVARQCTQHRCEISGWTQATTGGARASRLAKCATMEAMTCGSVITANTLTDPPQRGHTLTSMS